MNLKLISFFTRMRFLRFGLRDRIARLVHNPDKAQNKNFEVNFFRKKYIGNFSVYIDWSTYYFGAYAIEELEFIAYSLKFISSSINSSHIIPFFYSFVPPFVSVFERRKLMCLWV